MVAWANIGLIINGVLTYAMLRIQTIELGRTKGIIRFLYSRGWVHRVCCSKSFVCNDTFEEKHLLKCQNRTIGSRRQRCRCSTERH